MLQNALKMSKWFLLFIVVNLITVATCGMDLVVVGSDGVNPEFPVYNTVEAVVGSNLTLRCLLIGSPDYIKPQLAWGKRSKHLRFKNESDLVKLAVKDYDSLNDLYNDNLLYHQSEAYMRFTPIKSADQGAYFCMYLWFMLFKVVHVRVKENMYSFAQPSLSCKNDKFRCVETGHCINSHYKCDGRNDCLDGSDEHLGICNGDPCRGKIHCLDGRCIPTTWCCDKLTDDNCTVDIRPSCCPDLVDPYDPIYWQNNQTKPRDLSKGNGSRYLFISICVISAILSFVLFLFMISKICGFDKGPNRSRNFGVDSIRSQMTSFSDFNRCEHSECAIRRELHSNIGCIYRNTSNSIELVDPLISLNSIRGNSPTEISDHPPPYEEVVILSVNNDKNLLSDIINAPPPPYCSTTFFPETEVGNGGGNLNTSNNNANNSISNNYCNNNQNVGCDIVMTSDRNNRE